MQLNTVTHTTTVLGFILDFYDSFGFTQAHLLLCDMAASPDLAGNKYLEDRFSINKPLICSTQFTKDYFRFGSSGAQSCIFYSNLNSGFNLVTNIYSTCFT